MSVVLSPTPPVECLSTTLSPRLFRSSILLAPTIALVKLIVSFSVIPFRTMAIRRELIW